MSAGKKKITQPMRAHFGFAKLPFSKQTWAKHMFDSRSQRELLSGLCLWTEVRGVALVTGHPGVGKSITLRRFCQELDDSRFRLLDFSYLPNTVTGFLRSLNRLLGLPMRMHASDLFDDAQKHLASYEQEHGPHPVLVIDDAEGLPIPVLDLLRRLTAYDLDAEDRFSLLIAGTEELLASFRHPALASLRSRIGYAQVLRPFGMTDVREYVRHHLDRAGVEPKLFADDAVQKIFHSSQGIPRCINQLATQALIEAAVEGRDKIDGPAMARTIASHPLYQAPGGEP